MPRFHVERYVPNRFIGSSELNTLAGDDATELWSKVSEELRKLFESSSAGRMIDSVRPKDFTVYTGIAGIALTYMRAGEFCASGLKDATQAEPLFRRARDTAMRCLQKDPKTETVLRPLLRPRVPTP